MLRFTYDPATDATLDDRQRSTLENALIVAAERFDDHAKETRKAIATMQPAQREGYTRIAEQFDLQAADTRAILALVRGGDDDEGDAAVIVLRDVTGEGREPTR